MNIQQVVEGREVLEGIVRWLLTTGLRIVVIVLLAMLVVRVFRRIIRRFEERLQVEDTQAGRNLQRSKTLAAVSRSAAVIVVWTLALLTILKQVVPDIGPVLAGAGIAGIAIGFGAQSLVRDFLSGFFVLLEDQFRVGDLVEIDGVTGQVEEFSLRRTALRAFDGTLHHFANGNIQRISNHSAGWSRAILDVGVSYTEDLGRVRQVLLAAGERLMADEEIGKFLIEPPEILGVEDFGESQVTIRVSAKTAAGRQIPVGRAYRQIIKETFDREGISIPFPHRVMIQQPSATGAAQAEPGADAADGDGG